MILNIYLTYTLILGLLVSMHKFFKPEGAELQPRLVEPLRFVMCCWYFATCYLGMQWIWS